MREGLHVLTDAKHPRSFNSPKIIKRGFFLLSEVFLATFFLQVWTNNASLAQRHPLGNFGSPFFYAMRNRKVNTIKREETK